MPHSHHSHTTSERARQRATISRLRAIHHTAPDGTRYYVVYNLKDHKKYVVQRNEDYVQLWVCHCEAAKAGTRCKHVQRVLDREEARTKQEALTEAARENA
jgi:hypothetical protein